MHTTLVSWLNGFGNLYIVISVIAAFGFVVAFIRSGFPVYQGHVIQIFTWDFAEPSWLVAALMCMLQGVFVALLTKFMMAVLIALPTVQKPTTIEKTE